MNISKSSIKAVEDLKPGYVLGQADTMIIKGMAQYILELQKQVPVAMVGVGSEHKPLIWLNDAPAGTLLYAAPVPPTESQPITVTDDMALAFHAALTEGPIGRNDLEEIKDGLRGALCNTTQRASQPPAVPDNVVTAEHRRVIEMLLKVCGCAFEMMDDGCQMEVDGEPSLVVPYEAALALSNALDEIENSLSTEDDDRPDVFLAWSAMPRAALKSLLQLSGNPEQVNSPVIPDGWVLVPGTIYLDESDIESICSQCGNGAKNYGDFTRGILWVGNIQDDEGNITHGLHISSDDYPEEGGITLAKFAADPHPPIEPSGNTGELNNG